MTTLDIDRVRASLPGRAIDYYVTVDSTMRAGSVRPPGTVVLAEEQTAGLGRHGHSWHSEPGAGIYCTMVFSPMPVLTLALGLATVDALAAATGLACDLRWPNDVMLSGKKVAGILVQMVDGNAVAGIGINVNHTSFPPDLERLATSLRIERGGVTPPALSREDILIRLVPALEEFAAKDKEEVLRLFTHSSSYAHGRRVTVDQPGGLVEGTTAGLDPDGFLIVRQDNGTDILILAGGVRAIGA